VNPGLLLRDATMQELQLEVIRRRRFNGYDGEKVYAILQRHRHLWRAALLDSLGQLHFERPGNLPIGGLIKLRDLNRDLWNADHLFVLTHTRAAAEELATAFEEANIEAMPRVHDDQEETDMALGMMRTEYGLLNVWWD
jgi:hypothetical protein